MQHLKVLFDGPAKAKPGVDNDLLPWEPGLVGDAQALQEPRHNVAHRVMEVAAALVVHGHSGDAGLGSHAGDYRLAAEALDVVDHARAGFERSAGYFCLIRVDTDRDVQFLDQALDDGDDSVHLLLGRQLPGAGPRGFAADIDDVGSVLAHLQRLADGGIDIQG